MSLLRSSVLLSCCAGLVGGLGACGGVESEQGSSSTSTSTSTGGTGGTTGSAGTGGETVTPPPPCSKLVQTGALTELPPFPDSLSWGPRLLALEPGSTAIVRTIAIPGMGPVSMVTSNIAWTGDWPPAPSDPVELVDKPFYRAAVSRAAPNSIGLLGHPLDGSPGLAFGFADAFTGGWSGLVPTEMEVAAPVFLAADDDGNFFVGMAVNAGIPDNNVAVPHIGWVATKDGPSYVGPIELGCPTDPVTADAVATPGGWLMGRSIFEDDCLSPGGLIGITVFDDMTPAPGAEISAGPWADLDLLRRPDGAWLVYQGQGIEAVRLDAKGQVDVGPLLLAAAGAGARADTLDGGLVVASISADSPDLTIDVLHEQGNTLASASLALAVPPTDFQVQFDEETRQVLVAVVLWGESNPGPNSNVHVARFACQ